MTKRTKSIPVLLGTLFLLILVVAASLTSFLGSKTHYNILATDRLQLAPTYADLQNVSDIVVKATVIPGKENKLITADDGTVVFGYTITQLNVTEVFKGNINEDYPINITEEYYTLSGNGNEVYTQGNYMPAQESGEYIFFLKAYDSTSPYAGMYFPVDLEYGKYSVDLAETFTTPANASAAEYEVIALDEKYVEFATRVIEDYLQN
ncbi:MAG: hypothetical protein V8S75_06270 [[Ruminococcus] torques]|jgi:hypothetical protein